MGWGNPRAFLCGDISVLIYKHLPQRKVLKSVWLVFSTSLLQHRNVTAVCLAFHLANTAHGLKFLCSTDSYLTYHKIDIFMKIKCTLLCSKTSACERHPEIVLPLTVKFHCRSALHCMDM